jgi:hypothetical protein
MPCRIVFSALRKNLADPLVLLGLDETGVPVPRLGECG